jgi:hypothetical protein
MFTIQRKLALLLGAALSIAAIAAPAASADVPFEVRDSTTSKLCPAFSFVGEVWTAGGCQVFDFDGDFSLYMGNTQIANYYAQFDLFIGPDGKGAAGNQTMQTGPLGGFPRVPCTGIVESGPKPWPVTVRALGGGDFVADMKICIAVPSTPSSGSWVTFTVDIPQFGDDGMTELDQSVDSQFIRYAHWESDETVDLIETE